MSDGFSLAVQYASAARNLPTRAQFRRWIKAALHPQEVCRRVPGSFAATLPLQREVHITMRIVDEPEGRELNRNYRGRDYATNVLTFVYDDVQPRHGGVEPFGAGGAAERLFPQSAGSASNVSQPLPLSGDIVICAPVAEREAAGQHKVLLAHYAHLTLHAALHLQGFEHENDADAAEMEALETALMLKLRYPDPYRT
ncbi:MAG TPA: rRNA maturation RNase YbeY [Gallionella sp.]|nr:rRNA maturation RNase YbeY [Gallionella sp.]